MTHHFSLKTARLSATDHRAWLVLWQSYLAFYETSLPADTTARKLYDTMAIKTDAVQYRKDL